MLLQRGMWPYCPLCMTGREYGPITRPLLWIRQWSHTGQALDSRFSRRRILEITVGRPFLLTLPFSSSINQSVDRSIGKFIERPQSSPRRLCEHIGTIKKVRQILHMI